MRIGIRADGGTHMGMGHLMRCRSIAEAICAQGAEVCFFTAAQQTAQLLSDWGIRAYALDSDSYCLEEELPELKKALMEERTDLLLIDTYQVTIKYLQEISELLPVFYLDDMGNYNYPVQGLINYNIYGENLPYKERYSDRVRLLLGSSYAPLRPQFTDCEYQLREKAEHVLIMMGGSDEWDIAGALTESLLDAQPDIRIKVICGAFNAHQEKWEQRKKRYSRLEVLNNVSDMAEQMKQCDIAISAAGSTMYELCAVGVPSITCYYVENQRQIAQCFGDSTPVYNAGDYSKEPSEVRQRILKRTAELLHSRQLRQQVSDSMHRIADGNGASRIAEELIGCVLRQETGSQ